MVLHSSPAMPGIMPMEFGHLALVPGKIPKILSYTRVANLKKPIMIPPDMTLAAYQNNCVIWRLLVEKCQQPYNRRCALSEIQSILSHFPL